MNYLYMLNWLKLRTVEAYFTTARAPAARACSNMPELVSVRLRDGTGWEKNVGKTASNALPSDALRER